MIGVFDSGFGGLTVLSALIKRLPQYNYVYFGDSVRAPYGEKPEEIIYRFTCVGVDFLMKKGCKLVILACNTASANALRRIQQEWLPINYPERRVLGVVVPALEAIAEQIKEKDKPLIGVIGSRATIKSKVYEKEIKKLLKKPGRIFSQACPLLVPLIEEGWLGREETRTILKYYLSPLKNKKIQYLVPACTHYSILLVMIKKMLDKQTKIIDIPDEVSKKLEIYLNKHSKFAAKLIKNKEYSFYTSGDKQRFKKIGEKFLAIKIKNIENVILD
ncbi:glutamate racemase [bacterium]|nr:glutamate racemase [bacterium]